LDIAPDIKEEFIQQDGDLLTLQLGAAYDVATPSVEPHSGDRATLLIEPGYSNITRIGGVVSGNRDVLGQNFYVRTTIEYRRYWSKSVPDDTPLDQTRPVLAFRARYGVVSGTVPFFEQLFLGGADSLRGYENQRFWGKQSFLSSLEYRYPIQRSFGVIGFVDYGGAWGGYGQLKDLPQDRRAAFHLGYGLGISFRTPIAPIRIDFAFNEKGQTRTHFSFGTSF
jgi:outer membrane protein insertion porin family